MPGKILLSAANASVWHLQHRDGAQLQVAPRARMSANESVALLRAACAGLGIACVPQAFCREALGDGRLRRVLPDWNAGRVTTTLVMPHRRGLLPGVRATVEFLADCLRDAAADAA